MRLIRIAIPLIIISTFAWVIYSNIYHCPFVFDDAHAIEENKEIRNVDTFWSLRELLKPRAIVYFTFALNYKFSELTPYWYHFINVVIHSINGFLAYLLALTILTQFNRRTKAPRPIPPGDRLLVNNRQLTIQFISLFTALVFVAHPLQTQAVTYTVQRCASMAAMFYLGSVLFYLRARFLQQESSVNGQGSGTDRKHGLRLTVCYTVSILFGIFAFLSKANAASLPGAIVLAEYLFISRSWPDWKRKLPWFTLVFFLWLVFILCVSGVFSGGVEGKDLLEDVSSHMKETTEVTRWVYLCTQFNVLVKYIGLLFLPVGQNVDHMYPFVRGFFDGYTPLAFLLLIGIVIVGIWNIKRHPVISFGIFWFFITISVESSIIPIRDAMFEHRLYLPMFGFAFALSYAVFSFLSKRQVLAVLACAAIVGIFGVATYSRNRGWGDKITLWSDALAKNPRNFRAHNNLAVPFMQKGMYDRAIRHYKKALSINPEWALAHYNLGVLKEAQENYKEAMKHYSEAIQLNPHYAEAHNNLGTLFLHQGRLDAAAEHYRAAIKSKPDNATAHSNFGIVLTRQGKLDKAISHFKEALRLTPDDDRIRYNLEEVSKQRDKLRGNLN